MSVKGARRTHISLVVLAIMLAAILVTAGADAACAQRLRSASRTRLPWAE
jgi:hypothetical protein